ncbi:MAG: hypothetical protein FWD36_04265 [Treponema sp.]|nr:hypothetical protein [Treponema sp.]
MKKLIMMIGLCLLVAGLAAAQVARGGTLYVGIKSLALKSSTGFFAKTTGTLDYGDRVTVLQVSGKWVEIQSAATPSLKGWTASTNMSAKQIVSGSTGSATTKEIALAGKGFNQEIEDSYKAKGELNYADVDKVEAQFVNEDDLRRFLEEGRLAMGDK